MMADFDYATITLIDHRGHTVCQLVKEKVDSGWIVSDKPESKKKLPRFVDGRFVHEDKYKIRPRDRTVNHLVRLPDGRHRLNVPGPLIPWEPLPALLDKLFAQFGNMRITVEELHFCTKNM
jgi:hypothetical protein